MGSPNKQSPVSTNSATWWSLMENSDISEDERPSSRRSHRGSSSRGHALSAPATSPAAVSTSSSRFSSARRSPGLALSSGRLSAGPPSPDRYVERESPERQSVKKSLGTPRSYHRHHHHQLEKSSSKHATQQVSSRNASPSPDSSQGPSFDEEDDSEHKRIRWDKPTTHRYQLSDKEKPRLLEEKLLNVLDSVQSNMICSQNFERPVLTGSVWSLLDPNKTDPNNGKVESETNDSTSQENYSDDQSDDSVFEDGPSVVEITSHPPIFSESITASESILSTSHDSEDENDNRTNSGPNTSSRHSYDDKARDDPPPPADSSQILDDLSGMESERKPKKEKRGVEYDNVPQQSNARVTASSVENHNDIPPGKIYSTSAPFDTGLEKEKTCILSMGKLQGMNKSQADVLPTRKTAVSNHMERLSLRKKMKGLPNAPPIADISVGDSNEISTMSASEDSYTYHSKNKANPRNVARSNNLGPLPTLPPGAHPGVKGLHMESPGNLMFNIDSVQDETKSCIPFRLPRKGRGADAATASASSRSLGLRLLSRSGDAHTTSEKENDVANPYVYEYESGVNTYVAYFEVSKPKDTRLALQVIEHPNPPLLPFGSNEVVVKIEASTISQSDCAIRRGEWWGGTLSLPRIPGVAFTGKIDQIHKTGRNSMQRGDQVLSLVCSGSNSRYVCIPRERLVKVSSAQIQDPARLTCLPETYLSAFQALHVGQSSSVRYRNKSLSGKSIMFVGGVSAFGQAIIELGIDAGASVVYATASKVKQFQRIIEMGGIPLSATPSEWLPSISQQIDILIGSANEGLKDTDPLSYDHLNALKKKGQLILLGGPGAANNYPVILPGKGQCQVDVFKILKRAHKHNVFEQWERDMKQGKKDLAHLIGLLHKGAIKPKVLERIPLSKVSKAEEIVEARRLHGVIVCEPWIQEKQRHR
ncbi:quinone oxidoreductase [Seminavis robusta]|uniref:Quinone oxidoreductase n=1 Tax=Seminavis robusta TaxID=568900 RepID=A0A9N8DV99_9STRA|nr:quinone oxidoreductase [Seminavis robusta]|eukprot:Sro397_g134450.1 quinone oxidoreductase (931) ;mRNA; f:24845-27721